MNSIKPLARWIDRVQPSETVVMFALAIVTILSAEDVLALSSRARHSSTCSASVRGASRTFMEVIRDHLVALYKSS